MRVLNNKKDARWAATLSGIPVDKVWEIYCNLRGMWCEFVLVNVFICVS